MSASEDKTIDIKTLPTLVEQLVSHRTLTGTPLTYETMLGFAMLLDDSVETILNGQDATDPLIQISVVAAYLRRADVKGKMVAIV